MLKKLMVTTALTALMIGAAAAEGTGTDATPSRRRRPPRSEHAAGGEATEPASRLRPAPRRARASAKFINSQQSDQFLASKFKGTDVLGTDNEKIGDVSDILFDKNGKIDAYVVERRRLPRHRLQGRRARAERLRGRRGRQVEERVRQAEARHDQG